METILELIDFITKQRTLSSQIDTEIDPDYKINVRFKEFADTLIEQFKTLSAVYGDALSRINFNEAQMLVTKIYLQDLSVQFLKKCENDPIDALTLLVDFFADQISQKMAEYDRGAIKFYLVHQIIQCNVFPNERSEYNVRL